MGGIICLSELNLKGVINIYIKQKTRM